jgi:hypothetical protein
MAIFRNLCVRLRFESSKYFNVFLRLKSSPSLTLKKPLILGQALRFDPISSHCLSGKFGFTKDHGSRISCEQAAREGINLI